MECAKNQNVVDCAHLIHPSVTIRLLTGAPLGIKRNIYQTLRNMKFKWRDEIGLIQGVRKKHKGYTFCSLSSPVCHCPVTYWSSLDIKRKIYQSLGNMPTAPRYI